MSILLKEYIKTRKTPPEVNIFLLPSPLSVAMTNHILIDEENPPPQKKDERTEEK